MAGIFMGVSHETIILTNPFMMLQEQRATSNLRPEAVVWQMVRFFASQEDGLIGQMRWEFCGPFISSCKRLLGVLLSAEPKVC